MSFPRLLLLMLALLQGAEGCEVYAQSRMGAMRNEIKTCEAIMYDQPLKAKDQLLAVLDRYPDLPDSLRWNALLSVSICFGIMNRYDSALHYAQQSLHLATRKKDKVYILKTLGILHFKTQKYQQADSTFKAALNLAESIPHSEVLRAIILGECANVSESRYDYGDAIQLLNRGIRLCQSAKKPNPETELSLHAKMINTYLASGQLGFAEQEFTKILRAPASLLKKDRRGNVCLALNEILQKQGRLRESDSLLAVTLPLFEELNNQESIGYTKAMMAKNLYKKGNSQGALRLIREAYSLIHNTQSITLLEIAALYLNILKSANQPQEAQMVVRDSLILARQASNYTRENLAFQRAALSFLQTTLSPEDFLSQVQFMQIVADSVYEATRWAELLKLQAKYQLTIKDQKEKIITRENELLAKKSAFNGLMATTLTIVLGFLIVLGLFLATRAQLRQQKQRTELNLNAQKIDWLSQRVDKEIQERELKESVIRQLEDQLDQAKKEVAESNAGQVLGDKIKALKEGKTQIAAFLAQFSSIYPTFIEKLAGQNPELSKTDLLYCALYRIGLSYKEIGQALNIETASVYKRKYRIQGKLGLSNEEELNRVLFSL